MGTGSLGETIAAAAVESVLALLVAGALAGTFVVAGAATERVRVTAELARLELVLIDGCARVMQPAHGEVRVAAWRRGPEGAAGGSRLEIGRVDGGEGRLLVIDSVAGTRVTVAGVEHRFPSLRILRMEIVPAPVPHLSLTVVAKAPTSRRGETTDAADRARTYEIRAPFGSLLSP